MGANVNHKLASAWRLSAPVIEEISRQSEFIESLTYYNKHSEEMKVGSGGQMVKLRGPIVAPNFFDLLELRPMIGRTFVAGDGDPGAVKTIIISHGLWMRQFGGDPKVIGQSLELDELSYSVIGVMPSNVQYPFDEAESAFWLPHSFTSEDLNDDPRDDWVPMARLREGVSLTDLQSMLDVVAARRTESMKEGAKPFTIQAGSARLNFTWHLLHKTFWSLLEPAQLRAALVAAGKEMMVPAELSDSESLEARFHRTMAPRRIMMWLLITLSALALLLSVLGLYAVLAYTVSRRLREVGIRMALGATRDEVRRLFLHQGAWLVAGGILLGIALAVGVTRYVKSLLFGVSLADSWILAGVVLTLAATGFLASYFPARRAANVNPMEALRSE